MASSVLSNGLAREEISENYFIYLVHDVDGCSTFLAREQSFHPCFYCLGKLKPEKSNLALPFRLLGWENVTQFDKIVWQLLPPVRIYSEMLGWTVDERK